MILKFVNTKKLVTCETVRLLINEEIKRRVAVNDHRMKELIIQFDNDEFQINTCDTVSIEDAAC